MNVAPDWMAVVEERLRLLLSFKENWDGYGAAPIDPACIEAARSFLVTATDIISLSLPDIIPTRTGGIQFEWRIGPHEIEVEIKPGGQWEWLYENAETHEEHSGKWQMADPPSPGFLRLLVLCPCPMRKEGDLS